MNDRFARLLGVFTVTAMVSAVFLAPEPTQAATTSCATVAACLFGINAASGPGVEGTSVNGSGVQAASTSGFAVLGTSKSNNGIVGHTAQNATSAGTGKAGVSGYDDSTNQQLFNSGVYGVSHSAIGVQGRSTTGNGVLAQSLAGGNGLLAISGAGPLSSGYTNTAVVGDSANGTGVVGVGQTSGVTAFAIEGCYAGCAPAIQTEFPAGAALNAGTDFGGIGLNIVTDTDGFQGGSGVGATIKSGNVGLEITPDGASVGNPGLIVNGNLSLRESSQGFQGAIITGENGVSVTAYHTGLAVTGTTALYAQAAFAVPSLLFQGATSTGATVATLDNAGNLKIAGTVTQHGTFTSALRNSDGTYSTSYGPAATTPTVEDVGEANLVGGTAFIPLDAALLKTIDVARGYLVFLTPQGQTTGLYVAGKSRAGFSVREIANARDSLAFDYRIVAHPYGMSGSRLAPMAAGVASAPSVKPSFYRHLQALRFVRGKLDPSSLPKPTM